MPLLLFFISLEIMRMKNLASFGVYAVDDRYEVDLYMEMVKL